MEGETFPDYRFGKYLLRPQGHSLTSSGKEIPIRPKSFEVLLQLVRHHGHVVTRGDLLAAVWPETHITETVLSQSIWEIRRVFHEQGEQTELIRTIPKVGYQFIGDVCEIPIESDEVRKINSIAILPFRNLSPDPERVWVADAMTDSLITQLGKISPVRVISLQSVLRFKGSDTSLSQIGQQLGVDALVEGGALLADKQIRINAQLVKVKPEKHLWAEKYDRQGKDLFEVLGELALRIASEIGIAINPEARRSLKDLSGIDATARTAYLKGRYLYMKLTPESVKKALEYFLAAVAKDPVFALAHTGLADCYIGLEDFQAARAAAEEALGIDDRLAEAHVSLGILKLLADLDFQGAEKLFRHAVDLNPNCAQAHFFCACCQAYRGRADQGVYDARRAQELDPMNKQVHLTLCMTLYFSRQYDEALRQAEAALELYPEFPGTYVLSGMIYEQKQMYEEAIASYKSARELGLVPEARPYLGRTYGLSGMTGEARKILEELLEEKPVQPYLTAAVYLGLGEKDLAISWLERAYDERNFYVIGINGDPAFDPLRDDPRFQALVRRMGLEPQALPN